MPLPAPQELRTYFVTAVTANRRRLFQVEANADLLLKTLADYRDQKRYQLHAFVIMPDHLHAIFTPAPEVSLEKGHAIHQGRILFPPQKQTRRLVSKLQRFSNSHARKVSSIQKLHRTKSRSRRSGDLCTHLRPFLRTQNRPYRSSAIPSSLSEHPTFAQSANPEGAGAFRPLN